MSSHRAAEIQELSQALQRALATMSRGRCEAEAYVTQQGRVKCMLRLTRKGKQALVSPLRTVAWTIPSPCFQEALRNGVAVEQIDGQTTCVICSGPPGDDGIGILVIYSSAWPSSRTAQTARLRRLQTIADEAQHAFRCAYIEAIYEREHGILQELQKIRSLDTTAIFLDTLREKVLTSALTVVPTACIAHLLSVESDDSTGKPRKLRLEYAVSSSLTPPSVDPEIVGTCPPGHHLREYPVGEGVTGRAALFGQTFYYGNVTHLRNYKVFLKTTVSELAIPLKLRESVIGVLNLESELPDAFNEGDRRVLRLLASQIALVVSATSYFPERISLYVRAVNALEQVVSSLQRPEVLMRNILLWARQIGVPPLEYAVLTLDDETYGGKIESGDPIPSSQGANFEIVVPLSDASRNEIGTLALATATARADLNYVVTTLQTFGPVLAAALSASTNATSAVRIKGEVTEIIRNVRHTIARVRNVLDGSHPTVVCSTDLERAEVVRSALECLRIQSDFLVAELASRDRAEDGPMPMDVTEVISELTAAMRWEFDLQNVRLSIDVPNEQVWAKGPSSALKWAIYELLTNAAKFSPSGSEIIVSVIAIPGSDQVEVSISDEGPGIPEDELQDIWLVETRGSHALRHGISGSGRGLAIVARMCDRLGAQRDVQPNDRGGSTFRVVLRPLV